MIGEWHLVGSGSASSEIAFINETDPDPNGVSEWLNGFDEALVEAAQPTSGLKLAIAPGGSFAEEASGQPDVNWFDEEGVQSDVLPFGGTIVESGEVSYFLPVSIPNWATPTDGKYGTAVLRYDDGDTKIANNIRIRTGKLVRTVNVVTDELYLDRVVIIYQRING